MKFSTVVADGLKISRKVFEHSHNRFNKAKEMYKCAETPTLAVISSYSWPDSISYIKNQKAAFKEMGFKLKVVKIDRNCSAVDLAKQIEVLNTTRGIHGIQVHTPLPLDAMRHTRELINCIAPHKDVEGLTAYRHQELLSSPFYQSLEDSDIIAPCTALATLEVLEAYGIDCSDKMAVVLGRGFITGWPISTILEKKGASVTICDRHTTNTASFIRRADIVVSAVGKPDFFDLGLIKPGAAILDLGFYDDGGKIRGDIDYLKLMGKASLVTPVPRGIGPVTSAMVVRNLVLLWEAHARNQEKFSGANDGSNSTESSNGQKYLTTRQYRPFASF